MSSHWLDGETNTSEDFCCLREFPQSKQKWSMPELRITIAHSLNNQILHTFQRMLFAFIEMTLQSMMGNHLRWWHAHCRIKFFHYLVRRTRTNEINLYGACWCTNNRRHSINSDANSLLNLDCGVTVCFLYTLLMFAYDQAMNIHFLFKPMIVQIFYELKSVRIEGLINIDLMLVWNLIPASNHWASKSQWIRLCPFFRRSS